MQIDPASSRFAADPYAIYARMRAHGPVWFEPTGMWLLSRHEDVARVAADPLMVRSLEGIAAPEAVQRQQRAENFHDMPFHERFVQTSLLDSDGPKHRRLRREVFGAFRAAELERLRPAVEAFVAETLARVRGAGRVDFVADVAAHVPGHVISLFLGVPVADAPMLREWSETVVRFFDVDRTAAKKAAAEDATRRFAGYLEALVAERRARPRDDLVSRMIEAERAGAYRGDELVATAMLILMAGHGSTIDAMGSGLHLLLCHEEAHAALRGGADIDTAVQEMLRFEPPLPFFHRHALRDCEVAGRRFPAGTTFGLLYASANRDEAAFDRADTFDIRREPNRHLSFGRGAHLCLGNALARLSLGIVFRQLLALRVRLADHAEPVRYKPGLAVRGPIALPVLID